MDIIFIMIFLELLKLRLGSLYMTFIHENLNLYYKTSYLTISFLSYLLVKLPFSLTYVIFLAEWWSTYGGGCPNLSRLAIRILSQTCSVVPCKRNQIPFEQIMNTRNHIERQHLTDLVFVHYNLGLRQM